MMFPIEKLLKPSRAGNFNTSHHLHPITVYKDYLLIESSASQIYLLERGKCRSLNTSTICILRMVL